jgi:hypothetical protein
MNSLREALRSCLPEQRTIDACNPISLLHSRGIGKDYAAPTRKQILLQLVPSSKAHPGIVNLTDGVKS